MLVITVPQNGTRLCLRVHFGNHKHYLISSKEGRTPKNWCLRTVVLEKTPESPLDSKSKPINLKGDQPWIFTEKTDAEAPVFWSSDVNRQLFGRVPDAGKDPGRKEKRPSEDERAGWHHWCSEHELGQTPGDGEGQGGPACCSPWGRTELDTTGRLNNNSSSNAQWTLRYCIAVLVAVVLVYKFVWWRKKRFGQ